MTWPFMLKRTYDKTVNAYEARIGSAVLAMIALPTPEARLESAFRALTDKEATDATS